MSRAQVVTARQVGSVLRAIGNAGLQVKIVKVDQTGAVIATVGNATAAEIEGDGGGDADQKTIDEMIKRYRNQHSHEKKS